MARVLIDRYELGDLIGTGGAASVHRATDRRLRRRVAVKLLDDSAARSADPRGRDRFLHEARSAARIEHPHLVTIYDAGEDDGDLFLVMQFVDGPSLAEVIARDAPLPAERVVALAVQILEGLAAVHADGTIHRDIKPANVLIDRDGIARLTDFGIAKHLDDIEDSLTSAGMVVGTPSYLSPEQANGGVLTPATDIYLVGLLMYEMLTRRSALGRAASTVRPESFDPRTLRPDVPDDVADAVARATAYDPAKRFRTAADMLRALRASDLRSTVVPISGDRRTALMPAVEPPAGSAGPLTMVMPHGPLGGGRTTVAMSTPPSEPSPGSVDGPHHRWVMAVLVAVLVLVLVALAARTSSEDNPTEPSVVGPTTTAVAVPTAAPTTVALVPPVVSPPAEPGPADRAGPGNGDERREDKREDKKPKD